MPSGVMMENTMIYEMMRGMRDGKMGEGVACRCIAVELGRVFL
jgi:hypothetical protein